MKTVLDASVALAWLLVRTDRSEAMLARHLLDQSQHCQIHVPRHWHAEVGNGALRIQRAGAATSEEATAFIHGIVRLAAIPDRPPTAHDWQKTHHIALTHGLTVYDAAYVEPAVRSRSDLATFDNKLADAARVCGVAVLGQSHGVAEPMAVYG